MEHGDEGLQEAESLFIHLMSAVHGHSLLMLVTNVTPVERPG